MTEYEARLAGLLEAACEDIEQLHGMLHCHDHEEMMSEHCDSCPVKTDCELDDVPHWIHAQEAKALLCRLEEEPAYMPGAEDPRRPCFVGGRRAMWHRWCEHSEIVAPSILKGGHAGGTITAVMGLVEYADGTCAEVYPSVIVFAKSGFDERRSS